MSPVILYAEVEHLEQALAAARRYLTSLSKCDSDEATQQLKSAAERSISALRDKLAAARYRWRQASEVAA